MNGDMSGMKGFTNIMSDMEINLFFPTVIGSFTNIPLQEKMLPIAKEILGNEKYLTNTWGYKNTYRADNNGIENLPQLNEFNQYIKDIGYQYLYELGYDAANIPLNPHIFASEMFSGDIHPRHCHPNNILSGVFYLQVPKDSASLIFYDPKSVRDTILLPKREDTVVTSDSITFAPKEGLFLIWESWIHHQVEKNESSEGRITLVFNA